LIESVAKFAPTVAKPSVPMGELKRGGLDFIEEVMKTELSKLKS
jgi:hypothetical protein